MRWFCQNHGLVATGSYFFPLSGGTGTAAEPLHFPVAVLVAGPAGLPFVAVLPVSRPEASRY